MRDLLRLAASAALLLLLVPGAAAEEAADEAPTYKVGDRIEPFELEDQFGEKRRVDAGTRLVLFSRDMDGGDLLKAALEGASGDGLSEKGIVYVADIHGMPVVVSNLFARPAMRRRGYPMLLDRDGATTARLPDLPGRATLVRLDGLRIERLEFLDSAEAIRSSLGL